METITNERCYIGDRWVEQCVNTTKQWNWRITRDTSSCFDGIMRVFIVWTMGRKEMKYVWKIAGELAFHSTTNLHPHFPMHYAHRFGARMSSLHTANIRKKVIISQRFTRMKVKSIVKLFCFPNRKSLEKIKRREDLIREKLNVRAWKLSRKKIKPMRDSLFVSIETARYLTIIWLEADVI